MTTSAFTADELAYLRGERRLARIATVGKDGTPHVIPVGWSYNAEHDTIDVGGRSLDRSKKYRDVVRSGRACSSRNTSRAVTLRPRSRQRHTHP